MNDNNSVKAKTPRLPCICSVSPVWMACARLEVKLFSFFDTNRKRTGFLPGLGDLPAAAALPSVLSPARSRRRCESSPAAPSIFFILIHFFDITRTMQRWLYLLFPLHVAQCLSPGQRCPMRQCRLNPAASQALTRSHQATGEPTRREAIGGRGGGGEGSG